MRLASQRRLQQTRTLCRGYGLTMTDDITHLTADAAYWLGENDERRIRAVRSPPLGALRAPSRRWSG
jgi:hypothetical protein